MLLAGLLAACGAPESSPVPAGLEVVTAATGATTGANTTAATTGASSTEAATTATAAPTVPATTPNPTTAAATTASNTTAAATTALATTAAPTTAPATTAAPTTVPVTTKAAPTTAPATTKAAAVAPLKKGVVLEPMTWLAQTWNNCAPDSAVMALSYYGVTLTEAQCMQALRPNAGDKHVEPEELAAFIQSKGFKTVIRENGTMDKLRQFLSAGIPVITQQWLYENDDIGHYRVARGYDTATNTLIFNDSMDRKAKTVVGTDLQDKLWKGYDRRYFPVYTAAQEPTVMAILGEDANSETNMDRALSAAKKYSESKPSDFDGWRNLGYLYYATGDCKSAVGVWEQHLTKMLKPSENGPTNRFLWYQLWPIRCYNKLANYQAVIKLAPNEIEKAKVFAEARYEYAIALMNSNRKPEAIDELKKALLDDQNWQAPANLLAKMGVS
jgi:tetratricopeptide (TPR) repeat protein